MRTSEFVLIITSHIVTYSPVSLAFLFQSKKRMLARNENLCSDNLFISSQILLLRTFSTWALPIEVQGKKINHRAIPLAIGENCERRPHAEEMPGFCSRPWLSQIVANESWSVLSISVRSCVAYRGFEGDGGIGNDRRVADELLIQQKPVLQTPQAHMLDVERESSSRVRWYL